MSIRLRIGLRLSLSVEAIVEVVDSRVVVQSLNQIIAALTSIKRSREGMRPLHLPTWTTLAERFLAPR